MVSAEMTRAGSADFSAILFCSSSSCCLRACSYTCRTLRRAVSATYSSGVILPFSTSSGLSDGKISTSCRPSCCKHMLDLSKLRG